MNYDDDNYSTDSSEARERGMFEVWKQKLF